MHLHILGIRHHGVGSAKNVAESLKNLKPDIVLVEGPPELDSVIPFVIHKEMKPPVAVLGYNTDKPSQAVFYPFATFSPEWQAITYALHHEIPVRMMDLPLSHSFALELKKSEEQTKPAEETIPSHEEEPAPGIQIPPIVYTDPMGHLAQAAGYDDGELWWEHHFEQNYIPASAEDHFTAVMLSMQVLREHTPVPSQERDNLREAYMRKIIYQAEKEGFQRCAVICGAWHGPALSTYADKNVRTTDEKSLKSLPTTKVSCTWIPWTNTRLGMFTGYGAGIVSPGWYEHQWHHGTDKGIRWLTRVAKLFRQKKMDTSTAHIIEAYRLAEALASMRNLSKPGLQELNEATQTVICFGEKVLLKLVEEELIVGKATIGKVPKELPRLPIQSDFEVLRKKSRFDISESAKDYELDLRKELDLTRSRLLHRLEVLQIQWGKKISVSTKGTFKEGWRLRWQPEMEIELIEKGFWGNTIEEAASKFLLEQTQQTTSISQVASFIQLAIPAELFAVIEQLLQKVNELASISSDIIELMEAVGPLADISRYGNVRKTDLAAINQLVYGLLTRICIGLPNACYGLDEATSNRVFENIKKTDDVVRLLSEMELEKSWYQTLAIIVDKSGVNAIIMGCTCRLLLDGKKINETEAARRFSIALSIGTEPKDAAGWLEGFLKGSGTILLYDHQLWNLLYQWVNDLTQEKFGELLPILRRTFSRFATDERKQIGQKAKKGMATVPSSSMASETVPTSQFSPERGEKALETVCLLLGLT